MDEIEYLQATGQWERLTEEERQAYDTQLANATAHYDLCKE
jgi:ribonucleotide reductase beta subunit family protein with ferritin-like domain